MNILIALASLSQCLGADAPEALAIPNSQMYRDPPVQVSPVQKTYPPGLIELWKTALKRPERELRSRAALSIAEAHEGGFPGLSSSVPALVQVLENPEEHPSVVAAVIRALVVIDARESAPILFKFAKSPTNEYRDTIESTLARWDYKPARELWLERIAEPPLQRQSYLLAIQCLEKVREPRAIPRLQELTLSADTVMPVRFAAARALGEIRTTGAEADAKKLMVAKNTRMLAAAVLRRQSSPEAVDHLQALAREREPIVALLAVTRLKELDPKYLLPTLTSVLDNEGAEVRKIGVEAQYQHRVAESIPVLMKHLSDPHPQVRIAARTGLKGLATEFKPQILEQAMRVLQDNNWRGQEQAALLLAQLDHKPASTRLVALLSSDRSEVAIAVAWALSQLKVPETYGPCLDFVKQRHTELLRSGPTAGLKTVSIEALDLQLSHLAQLFGEVRYQPADSALRALVPRILKPGNPPIVPPDFSPVGPETRAAAVWALGYLHAGKPEAALVPLIESRLTGDGMFGRDDVRVRRMAALALARLEAKQSLSALKDYSEGTAPSADIVIQSCRMAASKLTGEAAPPLGKVEVLQRNWFWVPLK